MARADEGFGTCVCVLLKKNHDCLLDLLKREGIDL